ncbi:hypothetical protein TRFO_01267 [Tritrichomonas foetus]|uniref:Uncharacterized protein n=1 Tax=Tritrichomonas foetus TaxID=1144522 RepID=A0A1J4KCG5_9EUKA|nr:hypothetical protein TRFO_01267 [Tritrichomonas foetus]|eukprot:OHT07149.1 hypothetical protein TRFO_01267 [Tritrichomonas foetus]
MDDSTALSDLHIRKMRAIENLDFEAAEEIENAIIIEKNIQAEKQAKQISKEMTQEFYTLRSNHYKRLDDIEKQYEIDQKDIENRFKSMFEELRAKQIEELEYIDKKMQMEIHEDSITTETNDFIYQELLSQSSKFAYLGRFDDAKQAKLQAEEQLKTTLKTRYGEIEEIYREEKEELMEKHQIDAQDVLALKETELKHLEEQKRNNIEKEENIYKASIHALKSKCNIRCSVLDGDKEINQKYANDIIIEIENLENHENVKKEEEERVASRQKLRTAALTRTREIMNRNKQDFEETENYVKRTATAKLPKRQQKGRFLKKSFFTTQNTEL